jgi:hypothetical protein
MIKFIRNHQKKFLAVFGVLLMVIFIIPSSFKNGRGFTDRVVGHIDDGQPIYLSEEEEAEHQWRILRGIVEPDAQGQMEPISAVLGNSLYEAIEDKPVLFLLLQKEAIKQGVIVNDAAANTFVEPGDQTPEAQDRRQAIHALLLVNGLREQLANSVKYTEPMWTHLLAEETQKTRLSLVTFRADQFKASIPNPKPDQLKKQYESLSHTLPAPADTSLDSPYQPPALLASNSLGFGYELPRRVKLQFIEIPRRSLLDQVAKGKSDYDWEVAARRYYYSHESEFPSTLPGTDPATQPMTQPYAQARLDILDEIRGPEADALGTKVREAILEQLNQDYAEYAATTQPGAAPATAPASPPTFAAEHYLDQMALNIQKQFGILPIVRQVSEYESSLELSQELGIGQAKAPDDTTFTDYAIGSDDPAAAGKNLRLFEPSTWLSDSSSNNYVFRLTAVASAAPAPFEGVESTVAADWITQQAFDKALAAAKDLSNKAQKKFLPAVAAANGQPAFFTGYFQPNPNEPIPGDVVNQKAQALVSAEAQTLLGLATRENPHPIGVVPVPADRAVIVVQLAGLQSALPSDDLWRQQLFQFNRWSQGAANRVAQDYFTYDAVVQRLNYKPSDEAKGS